MHATPPPRKAPRPPLGDGRQALVEAAVKVLARNGMRGLTIRATAAEAGVTHGLVRHHFGSRQALLEATLAHVVEMTVDSISFEPRSGKVTDIAQDLSATIEATLELCAFQFEIMLEARRR